MKLQISYKEQRVFEHMKYIFSYVFQALLFLFLVTLLLQQFYPDGVKSYVNINWFMIIVIIFGAISMGVKTLIEQHKTTKYNEYLRTGHINEANKMNLTTKQKNKAKEKRLK